MHETKSLAIIYMKKKKKKNRNIYYIHRMCRATPSPLSSSLDSWVDLNPPSGRFVIINIAITESL